MEAFKTYSQRFVPDKQLSVWMEQFQQLMNDFVEIGLVKGANSYSSLVEAANQRLIECQLDEAYKASAASRALRMLTLYHKQSRRNDSVVPRCRRPMLASFKGLWIEGATLHIPGGRILVLNDYMQKSLSPYGALRLFILTPDWIHVTVSRHASLQHAGGMAGIDTNTDNITLVDTSGNVIKYDMGRIPTIIERCLRAKRGLHRNDARVRAALFRKYGQIERNQVGAITHKITWQIINHAWRGSLGLAVEDISGIRRRYTTKAGHTHSFLRKRHAWPYFEIRRQLAYKTAWYGIPLTVVGAEYTSSECSRCGGRTAVCPDDSKSVVCSLCRVLMNRDENAARNILRRGLRSGLVGSAGEATKGNVMVTKPSDSDADADQSAGTISRQDHR